MPEEKDQRLAKLYSLMKNGEWKDEYKGIIILNTENNGSAPLIEIRDPENEADVLHIIQIHSSVRYNGSDKCLIQWTEDSSHELALSFLSSPYRDQILTQITDYCNRISMFESTSIIMEDEGVMEKPSVELPRVTQGNFADIISMLFSQEMNCERILSLLTQNEGSYYRDLITCAQDCIDFEEVDAVHDFAKSIVTLLQLGSIEFVECALGDDNYLETFAVLEYFPETYKTKRINHREVFESRIRYHQVVDFKNAEVLRLIHITFRLMYIRDAVRVDMADLFMESPLTALINCQLRYILESICSSQDCVKEIVALLNPEVDNTEVICLIYDLFSLTCSDNNTESIHQLFHAFCGVEFTPVDYDSIEMEPGCGFSDLVFNGETILDAFANIVQGNAQPARTIQKLVLLVERMARLCPTYICRYFLSMSSPQSDRFLQWLVERMVNSDDYGVQQSVSQTVMVLVGRDLGYNMQNRRALHHFYTIAFPILVDALCDPTSSTDARLLLIEMISAFLTAHGDVIRSVLESDNHHHFNYSYRKDQMKTKSQSGSRTRNEEEGQESRITSTDDDVAKTNTNTTMEEKRGEEEEEEEEKGVQFHACGDDCGNSGEGEGGSRIMRAMERILRESPSNVLRCAVVRFVINGLTNKHEWFHALLLIPYHYPQQQQQQQQVERMFITTLCEVTTPSLIQKGTLLASSLLNLFQLITILPPSPLIMRIANHFRESDLACTTPFTKMIELAEREDIRNLSQEQRERERSGMDCSFSGEKMYSDDLSEGGKSSVFARQIREQMDEDAYFDEEEEEEMVEEANEVNKNVEEEGHSHSYQQGEQQSQIEGQTISTEEEKEEKEEKEGVSSIVSFFGAEVKPAVPITMNLSLNITEEKEESKAKRVKV